MTDIDNAKPHLTPEGKFALAVIGFMFPVFAISLILGKPALGISVCVCGAIVATALRFTWMLHGHAWYWIAVAVAILLQPLFILYVPWTNHAFRGTALLPFGLLDYVAVWGCIKITEKTMTKVDHRNDL
jgi:hypothetical protein